MEEMGNLEEAVKLLETVKTNRVVAEEEARILFPDLAKPHKILGRTLG